MGEKENTQLATGTHILLTASTRKMMHHNRRCIAERTHMAALLPTWKRVHHTWRHTMCSSLSTNSTAA
jgi:hypothetical protein